jgi:hypothetical protein
VFVRFNALSSERLNNLNETHVTHSQSSINNFLNTKNN